MERARRGEGPTFIEAKTYRIEGHFVGDPELYRKKEETMKIFHDTDPLKKFRETMEEMGGLMTAAECDELDAKCDAKIKAAKDFAMESVNFHLLRPHWKRWPKKWQRTKKSS